MSKIKKHVDDEYFRQIYFDGATQFDFYVIKWIPRHENQRADTVASSVLSPIQHQSLMLLNAA
jgi:hypothetical protein